MSIPLVSAIQQHLSIRAFPASRDLLPQISPGETLEAAVLEKCGPDRYLISLKDMTLLARSEAALRSGERIQVRVERLLPEITLTLLDAKGGQEAISDTIRWSRSNPESMRIMFQQLVERLQTGALARLTGAGSDNEIRVLLRLAESLLFSGRPSGPGLFIRDYMENLGLLWESSLRKAALHDPKTLDGRYQGLKGLLMQVAAQIREAMEAKGFSAPAGTEMRDLLDLLDTSVRTIEAQQIVNVLCQENGDG
jgi:hypothetical protein